MLPTLYGLLKIPPPSGVFLDGSDLAPMLCQQTDVGFHRCQPLFWHLQKSRPIVAMRDGRFSLVAERDYEFSKDNMFKESRIPRIKAGSYKNLQLFDLEADTSQTTDLAAAQPERLEQMKSQLLKINASVMSDGADWHLIT